MEQKRYMKNQLQDFCMELDRQATTRIDYTVPTNTNEVSMGTDGNKLWLNVPMFGEVKQLPMTSYAEEQIASYYKVHARYFRKMRSRGTLHLICANINEWIATLDTEKNKRLIRIVDNEVMAFLGPDYLCINNQQFVDKAIKHLEAISQSGIRWELKRMDITNSHLYMKITSPDLRDEVFRHDTKKNLKVGDIVEGGIIIRNSEVGDGSFIIEPYISVLRCTNGMVRTVSGERYKRAHRGIEQSIGPYNYNSLYYKETLDKVLLRLTQQIDQTFTSQVFRTWVEKLNQKSQVPLPNPSVAIDNFITHFKLSESLKSIIAKQLEEEQSNTLWGLSMAVTRIAQNEKDYETQIKLERAASTSMEMNPLILTTERKKKDETKEE